MTEKKQSMYLWSVAALLVWMVLFVIGLFPEISFRLSRELGNVVTQQALINNPWMITWLMAGFLGWFTYRRCIECDDAMDIALGKSTQVTILALTAFLPLHLERLPIYLVIPVPFYRRLILAVVVTKGIAWLYLITLLLRYYFVSGHKVFKEMPQVFPSALRAAHEQKQAQDAPISETVQDD